MYASVATSPLAAQALRQPCRAPRLLVTRLHRLYLTNAVHRDYSYPGRIGSTTSRAASTRLPVAQALLCLCCASGHAISPLDFSSVGRTGSRRAPGHCVSQRDYSSSGLHRLYCTYVVHPDALSRRPTSPQSVALALAVCPVIPLCVVTTRLVAATDILHLRHASRCLGTLRGSSCYSSSTTSLTSRVQVPRLVARLIVDFFAYAACPSASVHRTALRRLLRLVRARSRLLCLMQARRGLLRLVQARRRLLRLRHAYGCLDTSRGSSCGSSRRSSSTTSLTSRRSSSTTSLTSRVWVPRLFARVVFNLFTYAARPGALARRAARRRLLRFVQARRRLLRLRCTSACLGTLRGSSSTTSLTSRVRVPRHVASLVVDYFAYVVRLGASAHRAARRRLLRLRRASECLGTSRGLSSTTSPTLRVRVPRHVVRLVTRHVVDYSVRRDFVLWPHWLYFSHAMRHDYLSRGNTGSTSSTPRAAATLSSCRIASTIHLD
jgi:hypothetical protein